MRQLGYFQRKWPSKYECAPTSFGTPRMIPLYPCVDKKMAGSGSNVSSSTVERIKQLDAVEGDIINAIQSAGNFI